MISPLNFAQKEQHLTSLQLLDELVQEHNLHEFVKISKEDIDRLKYLEKEIQKLSKENPTYEFKLKNYDIGNYDIQKY